MQTLQTVRNAFTPLHYVFQWRRNFSLLKQRGKSVRIGMSIASSSHQLM